MAYFIAKSENETILNRAIKVTMPPCARLVSTRTFHFTCHESYVTLKHPEISLANNNAPYLQHIIIKKMLQKKAKVA